jgi:Sortase domain
VQGAAPAQPGPAIVAGHIDSFRGPGVFFRLHEVAVGSDIEVDTVAGPPARYQVVSVTTLLKADFPTEQVYGPTPAPELRLITCGGTFDRADRRYLSNVIVSAVLV